MESILDLREIDSHAERGADELHRRLRPVVGEVVAGPTNLPDGVGVVVPELVSPSGEVLTDVVIPGMAGDLASAWADLSVFVPSRRTCVGRRSPKGASGTASGSPPSPTCRWEPGSVAAS